jgi:Mn2+/Fe2+ NRAMP family transporter
MLLFSSPAIILNVGADIEAMGAVAHMLFPSVNSAYFSILFTVILLAAIIYLPYRMFTSVLKWLCFVLILYIIIPFLYKLDWMMILKATLIPTIRFDKNFIGILVAILGTTISPYLFFWQSNIEVEEMKLNHHTTMTKSMLAGMKKEVKFGMLFSNIVMFFIILSAGTVLFNGGIHQIDTVEQAAAALKPLAGKSAYILFSIGIIGTGFLAIPVLAGSRSFIISETFGWESGLDKKLHEAKPFYFIIAASLILGLTLNYFGITPVQALIYSAMLYGLTAPVMIAIILHICNNKKIMGEFTNGKWSNILGFATLTLMTASAAMLIYLQAGS